ncbi:proteolipid protein 2 [Cyprinus carpio]|uniref:Proteolipid protein 2 n=1 Tax=Cyprinus carpio TaxID=7962 RepID=A0A9Q9WMY2_CYPCA|nr:proteolipid protein 2 [Cyprinus carpio]
MASGLRKEHLVLCIIMTICKAVSFACYFCGCITKLVWAILIFIVYAIDLPAYLYLSLMYFQWLDLFRAITGSVLLLVTSLICLSWGWESSGEVAGSHFMTLVLSPLFLSHFFSCLLFLGLLAAAVLGYDAFGIIKYIKNPKQQGATATVNVMVQNAVH